MKGLCVAGGAGWLVVVVVLGEAGTAEEVLDELAPLFVRRVAMSNFDGVLCSENLRRRRRR